MFKGVRLKHLDKISDLRVDEAEICLHLVIERKPLDLCIRMGSFESPVQTISITASHTNNIKEVIRKITDATNIPIKYLSLDVKMKNSNEEKDDIVSLDDEVKVIQDYLNPDGSCPLFRVKHVIIARLHFRESNQVVNYYETVEDDSGDTIDDLLVRIVIERKLGKRNFNDVRDTVSRAKLKNKTLLRTLFKIDISVSDAMGPLCCGCFG
eukprot:TCONS_00073714-protein